jgi:hypothetical protein
MRVTLLVLQDSGILRIEGSLDKVDKWKNNPVQTPPCLQLTTSILTIFSTPK